jgi:dolichyl-phosphate-mannose--protein O-mannosyl transferase
MRNVEGALITGSLRPSNALYRLTGEEAFAILAPTGGVTPTGYRLARWTSVLFGAASLVLVFAVGCRLFSREVAMLAAFFLALSPWFITISATFKPDSLLVLLTLVTFWWSLTTVEEGTLHSYLVAGVGVGLATASKQNGLLACLPLVTATILRYRKLVVWRYLAAAGLASLVIFFALNPFPEGIASWIIRLAPLLLQLCSSASRPCVSTIRCVPVLGGW